MATPGASPSNHEDSSAWGGENGRQAFDNSGKGTATRNPRSTQNFAGSSSSSSRGKPSSGRERRRPFNLRDSIEAVFRQMVPDGDDEDNKIEVPLKFWDFYNCEMMVHFLHAAVLYLYSYINLVAIEENSNEGSTYADHKVEVAVQEQQRNLRRLAEHYGRIVLHCSNFERTKEDEKFFECFYYFTCAVLKLGIAPEYWGRMENELRYIFRGNMFNISSTRDNGEELGDKNEWDNKADVNFTDGLSPSLENAPNNSVDHGISAGSKAICRNNQTLLDRVKLNMKESENLRNRITDKRKASPRLSNAGKFSIHSALSARSPIISLILPTQKEKADMSAKSIEDITMYGSLSARSSSQHTPYLAKDGAGRSRRQQRNGQLTLN